MTLTDGAGNSLLLDGVEAVTGAEGFDEVTLSDANTATLGISGVEVALGGTGDDRIHSSNADLTSIFIDGGLGNDTLTGDDNYSVNADLFILKGNFDAITDFVHDINTDFLK